MYGQVGVGELVGLPQGTRRVGAMYASSAAGEEPAEFSAQNADVPAAQDEELLESGVRVRPPFVCRHDDQDENNIVNITT